MHHLQTIELIILKSNIRKYIHVPPIYDYDYEMISLKHKEKKNIDHLLLFLEFHIQFFNVKNPKHQSIPCFIHSIEQKYICFPFICEEIW